MTYDVLIRGIRAEGAPTLGERRGCRRQHRPRAAVDGQLQRQQPPAIAAG